ncbi:NADH dehydrogenase subunit J [Malonomonas rubra DSM 5091]|uniref:NADH-quinone oxidoreductase subunit J n=1 Tax=Malonomonas rubra DSM 5091 TaxID=1122189 RepID=A0A1M6FM99_MALRU|nr:NADH-quinone oxidoreductase subunit J [Malonomonas rubra]SHI98804.1 NADH dehydrogenase subunit J [Malonomonas rubra DSM 5091]
MMATLTFYLAGAIAVIATALAITRSNPVHAVIYLVNSFFALALLFYLLGAPLLAAWELIIYAGAIMVLFLFIIMMLKLSPSSAEKGLVATRGQWVPVVLLAVALASCTMLLTGLDPATAQEAPRWHASPRDFGYALFKEYALAVEIASFQLLFAAVGAFYVGRPDKMRDEEDVV